MEVKDIRKELGKILRIFDTKDYTHGIFKLNKLMDKLNYAASKE